MEKRGIKERGMRKGGGKHYMMSAETSCWEIERK
jgi:hypothetical protein